MDECYALLELITKENGEPINNESVASSSDTAEEIIKFKQLLDMGAITEEEYEAKKKQLLGI